MSVHTPAVVTPWTQDAYYAAAVHLHAGLICLFPRSSLCFFSLCMSTGACYVLVLQKDFLSSSRFPYQCATCGFPLPYSALWSSRRRNRRSRLQKRMRTRGEVVGKKGRSAGTRCFGSAGSASSAMITERGHICISIQV